MKRIKTITLICALLIPAFILVSCKNNNNMTEKDQEDVQAVISNYLQAVVNKDFETVRDLTESKMKKYYPIEELKEKQMGIENLKIANLEPYNNTDHAKKTPTRLFHVDLDITPNGYGSWNDGMNPRFIWGVKEGDEMESVGIC